MAFRLSFISSLSVLSLAAAIGCTPSAPTVQAENRGIENPAASNEALEKLVDSALEGSASMGATEAELKKAHVP